MGGGTIDCGTFTTAPQQKRGALGRYAKGLPILLSSTERAPRVLIVLLLVSVAGACSSSTSWRVGFRSYGPIQYGMTLAEASQVLGEKLAPGEEESGPGCSYIYPKAAVSPDMKKESAPVSA